MYNKCKSCPFAKWYPLDDEYYNLRCDKMDKLVEYSILKSANVMDPSWCPEIFGSDVQNRQLTIHPIYGTPCQKETPIGPYKPKEETKTMTLLDRRIMWDKLVPQIEWNTIEKGKIYHIPPYLGSEKRFDIEIIFVCNQYFTYKKVGEYTSSYVYPNDLLYKVMVQSRTKIAKKISK